MPTTMQKLTGTLILVLVPIGLVSWVVFCIISDQVRSSDGALVLAGLFYLAFVGSSVTYDTPRISRIDMTGIGEEVVNLITKTTLKGDRLYVILLRAFKGTAKLSQTELFKKAAEEEVDLTQPQVRDYIIDLEKAGLISSPPTKYAKAYELTERGRWCRQVINQLLPSRMLLYILRDYLGYRHIPPEPASPIPSPMSQR